MIIGFVKDTFVNKIAVNIFSFDKYTMFGKMEQTSVFIKAYFFRKVAAILASFNKDVLVGLQRKDLHIRW